MRINFISNYQNGYVGEISDATHITREIEALGHTVQRVNQDVWKAIVDGESDLSWQYPLHENVDINIITKWHHFDNEEYITFLREKTNAPVFYWVWDYMPDPGIPLWHMKMVKACDLYLTNEYGIRDAYIAQGMFENKVYYFPFDVCDGDISVYRSIQYAHDVVFFGSCIPQGHRIEWLEAINKEIPIVCYSWNHEEWKKRGFEAYPAVYGEEFNKTVSHSKICLGFSVEPNCYGYWSNRVGKTLCAGGFLLYEYAPGMELMIGDAVEYFSSPREAVEKIRYFLAHDDEIIEKKIANREVRNRFTSAYRVKQLMILIDRYLKRGETVWKL